MSYLHLRLSNEEEELLKIIPEGKFFSKDLGGGQKTAYVLAALEHKGRVERAGMGGYHDRYIVWRLRAYQRPE